MIKLLHHNVILKMSILDRLFCEYRPQQTLKAESKSILWFSKSETLICVWAEHASSNGLNQDDIDNNYIWYDQMDSELKIAN